MQQSGTNPSPTWDTSIKEIKKTACSDLGHFYIYKKRKTAVDFSIFIHYRKKFHLPRPSREHFCKKNLATIKKNLAIIKRNLAAIKKNLATIKKKSRNYKKISQV